MNSSACRVTSSHVQLIIIVLINTVQHPIFNIQPMFHQRVVFASSVSSTGSDISIRSNLSDRTVSSDSSEASVAAMLAQSVSTLSDMSIRADCEGGLLPSSDNPSLEGSMESVRSVMSINDIIKPEQHKSIQQILLDIQAHSTPTLVYLAIKGLTWLSQQDPTTRQLSSPARINPAKRVDSHRLIAAMLECVTGDRPKRYVAAAIITCGRDIDEFIRLANTWFGLFLWPCLSATLLLYQFLLVLF